MSERKTLEITNFYSHLKKNDKEAKLRNYPNKDLVNMDLPFRALLLGPSGSGKTNLVLQIIKSINKFDKVILIAKNLEEPLYAHLIETYRRIERETKSRILLASTDLKDLPPLDELDVKENSLLIVDDFICEDPKDLRVVEEYWIRGRKQGLSMMFLSQSYFDTPKKIRRNSNYVIIKKLYNTPDLKRILKEYSIGLSVAQLEHLYDNAVAGSFTNFFMLDMNTNDPSLKYRRNFEGIDITK
jgi:DNA replication protein DnaC